ncbi:pyruvate kinase, partial [Kibdelosporangium lantanae]
MSRRAKIVCTLGPAVSTPERLLELVEAGMDVARMNFSHGSHSDHKQVYDLVRAASDQTGHAVGIMGDLQGPKIRLGTFAAGPVEWATGEVVRVTVEDVAGTVKCCMMPGRSQNRTSTKRTCSSEMKRKTSSGLVNTL